MTVGYFRLLAFYMLSVKYARYVHIIIYTLLCMETVSYINPKKLMYIYNISVSFAILRENSNFSKGKQKVINDRSFWCKSRVVILYTIVGNNSVARLFLTNKDCKFLVQALSLSSPYPRRWTGTVSHVNSDLIQNVIEASRLADSFAHSRQIRKWFSRQNSDEFTSSILLSLAIFLIFFATCTCFLPLQVVVKRHWLKIIPRDESFTRQSLRFHGHD